MQNNKATYKSYNASLMEEAGVSTDNLWISYNTDNYFSIVAPF